MQIQAIETQYLGYKFRSRLQARWAVFFHAAGIPFEYQPEGFKLESGYYLPDFYLPWFKCYIQIKPKYYDDTEGAKKKLVQLYHHMIGDDGPQAYVMLCLGDPYDFCAELYCFMCNDSSASEIWVSTREDGLDFYEGLQWPWGGTTKHYITLGFSINHYYTYPRCWSVQDIHGYTYCRSKLQTAKLRARQARFQHGEKP